MCSQGPHFKLCTCDPEHLGRNHWRLRRSSNVENIDVVGEFLPPIQNNQIIAFDSESYLIDRILHDINNVPVFDFDYTPSTGDLLEITISEVFSEEQISLYFVYSDGEFAIPSSGTHFLNDGLSIASGEVKYVPKPK